MRNRLAADPVADALLTDLTTHTRAAIADIRRLVYALRPPAHLPPLPAAVEVAAFRIAQEAMTNVVWHAMARTPPCA